MERGKIAGFLNNAKDADILSGLAEDIRDAMMDYQVCTRAMSVLTLTMSKLVQRLRCSKTSFTKPSS